MDKVLSYYPDSNMYTHKHILTALKQFKNKYLKETQILIINREANLDLNGNFTASTCVYLVM